MRATSAATTFFEPFMHGQSGSGIRYIDPGLGFNNPSDLVLEEATSLWGDSGYLDIQNEIGCLLSIGTGIDGVERMDNTTILQYISAKVQKPVKAVNVIKNIATGTGRVHRNVARRFKPASGVYQRFNVNQGLQAVSLFDHEKREDIEVDTSRYLDEHYVGVQLFEAVDRMKSLGVRTPTLLEDREEAGEIHSVGSNGDTDPQKLKERLDFLRM